MNLDPPTTARPTTQPARRAPVLAAVALAAVVGLGAGACSSDTTTAAGPATTGPAVTASSPGTSAGTGTTATSAKPETTAKGTSTTARGTTSTSDPNVLTPPSIVVHATPGNEEFCTKVSTALQELSALALASIGGTGDADQLLPPVKALYAELAASAPSDIAADVKVISTKLQAITTAKDLRTLDDDPEASAAGQRFTAWIKSECGFDPNNPGG